MLGLFRRAEAAPLNNWLIDRSLAWFEKYADTRIQTATDGQKLLGELVFAGVLTSAGCFLKATGPQIRKKIGSVGADVLAFEVLAFTFYAMREHHLPTPDYLNDSEPEELIEAYRFTMGALPHLIGKETGWDIEKLWERRVMPYFGNRKGLKDATESFVGTLLTMRNVREPAVEYGRLSLDLPLNLDLRMRVHTYASELPKSMADAIQVLSVDYGLVP